MRGFEYHYNTPEYIIENILFLAEKTPFSYGLFSLLFILIILNSYYIIPSIYILIHYLSDKKEKHKRKKFIRKIVIQKDIEDQISKEIHT
ncbi:MAG: hypothetical protein GY828_08455 [Candidatus Gracilibacteria bacterium]|nr:hypothetical protein [Candidatus Gracilibacteria bacterium]